MAYFRPNLPGIQAMLVDVPMQDQMRRRAERGRAYAQAIAPVDTGRYRASMTVLWGIRNGKAYARLENPTPYAKYLEWGTRYMRRFRTLGRAMDAMR